MALKFYTNETERLQLKVRNFWELIPRFVEVIREKLLGGFFNITNLICDTLNVSLDKNSLNRRAISTLVLILSPLIASVALI